MVADSTFHDLKAIRNHIMKVKELEENKPVPMVLVGNKADLEDKRAITKAQGLEMAKEFGIESSHFYVRNRTDDP